LTTVKKHRILAIPGEREGTPTTKEVNMEIYFGLKNCVKCGTLIAYAASAMGSQFHYHECKNIYVDASCREPSDIAPHRVPLGNVVFNTPMALGTSTSSTSASSAINFVSQFK
jgi:hypothetical protein